ncbi:hypothetical protein JOE50_003840 [Bradyrhizobium japonicum]|nr:hypothetical protein [Bradyrhizobium japonicum]
MTPYGRALASWSLSVASLVLFEGTIASVLALEANHLTTRPLIAERPSASPRTLPSQRRTTTDGVLRLDEPVTVRLRSTMLQVPAAYLSPWPHAEVRHRVNDVRSLRFEFWMPDGRYLEVNPISNASFRPKEPGRAEPSQDAFVVRVWDVLPSVKNESRYVSPDQAFQNQVRNRYPPNSPFSFREEAFGLVRFWPADDANSDYSISYRNKDGADPQLLLDCVGPGRFRVFLACSARVYLVPGIRAE